MKAEKKETERSAVLRDRTGHQGFRYRYTTSINCFVREKRPKNMYMKLGPRGTNGSGNGCHGNGKEKSTKGITNTFECKCV